MAFKKGQFCWQEIATPDVAAARKFYTEMFGWEAVDVPMPGPDGGTYTLIKRNGEDIAGMFDLKMVPMEGIPPAWMTYVYADDVDATAAEAKKLGGNVLMDACDIPEVGRMAMLQDPTGAMFSVFKTGAHGGCTQNDMSPGTFCWRELMTPNPDGAGKFYTDLLGWGAKPSKAGQDYTEFQIDGESVAGMMAPDPAWGPVPAHWGTYVAVEDCDAAVAKAQSLGGQVNMPPTDIEPGRFAMLADPTGAAFSVIKLKM